MPLCKPSEDVTKTAISLSMHFQLLTNEIILRRTLHKLLMYETMHRPIKVDSTIPGVMNHVLSYFKIRLVVFEMLYVPTTQLYTIHVVANYNVYVRDKLQMFFYTIINCQRVLTIINAFKIGKKEAAKSRTTVLSTL